MKVLFDQGTPAPLRRFLLSHEVQTAAELGWSNLSNGDLLSAAENDFEGFVTTDQNLRNQQNLAGRRLAILVLPYASWKRLRTAVPQSVAAVDALQPGDYIELILP